MSEYAHKIAPDVDGARYIVDVDSAGVAEQKVAYHAARAYGFIKGWEASGMTWTEGLSQGLMSFELALLYQHWSCNDLDAANNWSANIASILASPEVIEEEIDRLLTWCEIDANDIKPYGSDRR